MPGTNEAFSRVKIDAQLKDQGWDVLNPNAVRFEYVFPDKTKADYVLCDRHGRALAVIEVKRAAINPAEAEVQAKAYPSFPRPRQLGSEFSIGWLRVEVMQWLNSRPLVELNGLDAVERRRRARGSGPADSSQNRS